MSHGLAHVPSGGRDAYGRFENIRWLGGDQTHQGRHVRLDPGVVH